MVNIKHFQYSNYLIRHIRHKTILYKYNKVSWLNASHVKTSVIMHALYHTNRLSATHLVVDNVMVVLILRHGSIPI